MNTIDAPKYPLYFSFRSGEIYEAREEYEDVLDIAQIPLTHYPNDSCKTCKGRLYTGYNNTLRKYELCSKCVEECVDKDKQHKRVERIKNERVILNEKAES